jgi:hypothetical protein
VEVGRWEEGDDELRENKRWSKYCGLIKGLRVGKINIDYDRKNGK